MQPRLLVAMLLAVLAAGCGEDEPAPRPASAAPTELRIAVDPDGKGPRLPREHRLRCPGARVCGEVDRVVRRASATASEPGACTGRFGGSATARISGRQDRRPVDLSFARRNGCDIARWEDAEPLLALAGG